MTNLTQTFRVCHLCTYNVAAIFFRGLPNIWRTTVRHEYSITTTHEALGALLAIVTMKTDLQSTVVEKYPHFHSPLPMIMLIVRS